MKIGVDLDNTLFNTVENALSYYNKDYNDNINLEDITEYDMDKKLKIPTRDFFKKYAMPLYTNTLVFYPKILNMIHDLRAHENSLYFVSSCYYETIPWRHELLSDTFDWYTLDKLIVCNNKQSLNLDILVDDCLDNLIGGNFKKVVVDMPWNRNIDDNKYDITRLHIR